MKKLLLIFATVILAANAFAEAETSGEANSNPNLNPNAYTTPDERSDAMLAALAQRVAGWGDYRVDFRVTIDGQALAGSYEVSGAAYHLTTPDIELFCDGTTKWEVNLIDREVAIDRVDPADRTVLGNPTRLFDFLDGTYTHRYLGAAMVGGVNCERIELLEVGNENGQKIEAFISTATGMPVRLSYGIEFLGTNAVIDVERITPRVTLDRATFSYNPSRYAGWDVIDFR